MFSSVYSIRSCSGYSVYVILKVLYDQFDRYRNLEIMAMRISSSDGFQRYEIQTWSWTMFYSKTNNKLSQTEAIANHSAKEQKQKKRPYVKMITKTMLLIEMSRSENVWCLMLPLKHATSSELGTRHRDVQQQWPESHRISAALISASFRGCRNPRRNSSPFFPPKCFEKTTAATTTTWIWCDFLKHFFPLRTEMRHSDVFGTRARKIALLICSTSQLARFAWNRRLRVKSIK